MTPDHKSFLPQIELSTCFRRDNVSIVKGPSEKEAWRLIPIAKVLASLLWCCCVALSSQAMWQGNESLFQATAQWMARGVMLETAAASDPPGVGQEDSKSSETPVVAPQHAPPDQSQLPPQQHDAQPPIPATTLPAMAIPAMTIPATTIPATTIPAMTIPATSANAKTLTLKLTKPKKAERFVEVHQSATVQTHGAGSRRWVMMPEDFYLGDKKTGLWFYAGMGVGVGDNPTLVVVRLGKGGDANRGNQRWKLVLYDFKTKACTAKVVNSLKLKVPSVLSATSCFQPSSAGHKHVLAMERTSSDRRPAPGSLCYLHQGP
jgi:hypothetical protein